MLLAVLYCEPDQVAAAAFACDQQPIGDRYWSDFFPGELAQGSIRETAHVTVNDYQLCYQLLNVGIDDQIDGRQLATALENHSQRQHSVSRAA